MNIKLTPLIDTLRLENIDDSEYFSVKYSNYISNSRLGLLNPDQGGSPELFFNSKFNTYSESLIFGSALHELILQPESFELVEGLDKPTAKTGMVADECVYNNSDQDLINAAIKYDYYHGILTERQLKELRHKCASYWDQRKHFESHYKGNKKLIYLNPKDTMRLKDCITSLEKNKNIQWLLHPTGLLTDPIIANEKTILLDIQADIEGEAFILKLKSKLDNFTIEPDIDTITVNDLKSTGQPVDFFYNAIDKFHYNREIAMYSWLLSLCAKKFYNMDNPVVKGNYLAITTCGLYETRIVSMNKSMYQQGFSEFKKLLKFAALCYYKGYRFE